jgi:hypothetical protein
MHLKEINPHDLFAGRTKKNTSFFLVLFVDGASVLVNET